MSVVCVGRAGGARAVSGAGDAVGAVGAVGARWARDDSQLSRGGASIRAIETGRSWMAVERACEVERAF